MKRDIENNRERNLKLKEFLLNVLCTVAVIFITVVVAAASIHGEYNTIIFIALAVAVLLIILGSAIRRYHADSILSLNFDNGYCTVRTGMREESFRCGDVYLVTSCVALNGSPAKTVIYVRENGKERKFRSLASGKLFRVNAPAVDPSELREQFLNAEFRQ